MQITNESSLELYNMVFTIHIIVTILKSQICSWYLKDSTLSDSGVALLDPVKNSVGFDFNVFSFFFFFFFVVVLVRNHQ